MLLDPAVLGALMRNLQEWQSLYEAEGIDSLTGPDGDIYCLADLLRLRELSRHLEPLQAMAIQCLYEDLPDAEAARRMQTDGVAGYAQAGLIRLCLMFEDATPAGDDRDGYAGTPAGPLAFDAAEAAQRGLPPAGGLRGCPDSAIAPGRDLAVCQV
jgi:hypothetical protein